MTDDRLATARVLAAALAAGPLVLLALAHVVLPRNRDLDGLASLAALLGLLALPIAWRVHGALAERGDRLRALVVALAITESASLLGILAYGLTGRPWPLLPVALHLVLVGALWPREEA